MKRSLTIFLEERPSKMARYSFHSMSGGGEIRIIRPLPFGIMKSVHGLRLGEVTRNLTALIQECIDEED